MASLCGKLCLLVLVAGRLGSAFGATCSEFVAEGPCEAAEGCYWATWDTENGDSCKSIPTVDIQCKCTLDECGGDTPLFEGPSGCEPVRFCYYKFGKCRAGINNAETLVCVENGNTMTCAPSEFCEPSPTAPTNQINFGDDDCIPKINGTYSPTKSPTRRPTGAPTPRKTSSPTDAPEEGVAKEYIIIGSAVGGVVLLGGVAGLWLYGFIKNRKFDPVGSALVVRAKRDRELEYLDPFPDEGPSGEDPFPG